MKRAITTEIRLKRTDGHTAVRICSVLSKQKFCRLDLSKVDLSRLAGFVKILIAVLTAKAGFFGLRMQGLTRSRGASNALSHGVCEDIGTFILAKRFGL